MSATSPPIDVDLWVWSLDVDDAERGRLSAFLTEDEAARAARFVFDRYRFVVGRGRLREVLAGELAKAPAALRFAYAAHGKPSLVATPDFHFNLSHSDALAALTVSRAGEIGVGRNRGRY